MKLELYKATWGMTEPTLEEQLAKIKQAGYNGVESPIPEDAETRNQLAELCRLHGLNYIAQIQVQGETAAADFAKKAAWAEEMGAVLLNSHTGRDTMEGAALKTLFDAITETQKEMNIPVCHETHRSRPTFTPWTAKALLDAYPELQLTADFSHFCCVCESLLEDQKDTMKALCKRSGLIHARVGYPGGPQVPDPAAPEYAAALAAHETWWKQIAQNAAKQGSPVLRVTVEYGPYPYMHHLPFSNKPVADLWELCLWGKQRFETMFSSLSFAEK